jgi:WD40 repeat protein
VVFAPNGRTFVTTGDPVQGSQSPERLLVEWDAATGRELRQFKGHRGGVQAAAFSTDGKRFATGGIDGTVLLWDFATGKQLQQFSGHNAPVLAVAYSPDQKVLASAGQDASVRVWDADSGDQLRRLPRSGPISRSASGTRSPARKSRN